MKTSYKLTQYSHGAGCGCKISPAVLDSILAGKIAQHPFPGLLVGNEERDDAAVLDLGDGTVLISTTDFFMPVVDDAFDFGRIASVNALSDIYAMGGTPILAIAILGWPIEKIPAEVASRVLDGAREVCTMAGIPLAGGHSIDTPEPIFGLSVNGRMPITHLRRNGGAKPGDFLFLTKGLGIGVLTTAQKKGLLRAEDAQLAMDSMLRLNDFGTLLGSLPAVHALTDITGFGLGGHLCEMMAASNATAHLKFSNLPLLSPKSLGYYLKENCIPGGTARNYQSFGHLLQVDDPSVIPVLCDPQTSGGLLIAVDKEGIPGFLETAQKAGYPSLYPIGEVGPEISLRVVVR